MPELDVVVVAYRSHDALAELLPKTRELAGVASVTVVDNGDDGSADVAERNGAAVIRRPDNPGFGASQNLGAAHGTAPFILLLNPDASPIAPGIERGLQYLVGHDDVAAVQGAIVNRTTGTAERSQGVELGPLHLFGRALGLRRVLRFGAARALMGRTVLRDHVERRVDEPRAVESLAATVLLVRRAAFDDVGGFDPHYFLYGEDLDLCRRLRDRGWKLVAMPDDFAVHESGASSSSGWERELHWWQGTMRFAARWWSTPRWLLGVAASVVRWAGLALRRPSQAGRAWRSVVASGFSRGRRTA